MEGKIIVNKTARAGEKPAFRPLVYVCAPYSGDVEENTKRAAAFAKYAYDKGNIPLTAHLLLPICSISMPFSVSPMKWISMNW